MLVGVEWMKAPSMDDLLHLILVLLRWRVFVAISVASGMAILGVRYVPWLSGLQGLVVVALGLFAGLAWESRTEGQPVIKPPWSQDTKPTVAMLAFFIGGSFWGAISSTSFAAAVFGAALAVVGLAAWSWTGVVLRRNLRAKLASLYSFSLLAGYAFAWFYFQHYASGV
ncbi:hypothetical protein RQP54_05560 [Curvibacter sp. APW13]|uniref:hypothetical protein n=1 Tax=Curvibacter sp. APW13 TaxID=3077236 RepID=UPI0028DEA79D|nr:hypothetical protein [Curvibacter sp. APW13]MDT8990328.1 hypothetical protein [Curvibacter sp. APW13]